MVKIVFCTSIKGPFITVDVDPMSSIDDVKKILISQHGYKDGTYILAYSGKILKGPTPFKDLKDNSKIIVLIKGTQNAAQASTAAPAPTQKPTPSTAAPVAQQPQQQQQARQPSTPRPPPRSPTQPSANPAENQQRPQMSPQQQIMEAIKKEITDLHIEEIFKPENQIWENPARLAEISEILNSNPSHLCTFHLYSQFALIPGVDPTYLLNTMLLLLDVQQNDFISCQSDYEAKYETLSKSQKEILKNLISQFKDVGKEKVLEALENASFNKEEAEKALATKE